MESTATITLIGRVKIVNLPHRLLINHKHSQWVLIINKMQLLLSDMFLIIISLRMKIWILTIINRTNLYSSNLILLEKTKQTTVVKDSECPFKTIVSWINLIIVSNKTNKDIIILLPLKVQPFSLLISSQSFKFLNHYNSNKIIKASGKTIANHSRIIDNKLPIFNGPVLMVQMIIWAGKQLKMFNGLPIVIVIIIIRALSGQHINLKIIMANRQIRL